MSRLKFFIGGAVVATAMMVFWLKVIGTAPDSSPADQKITEALALPESQLLERRAELETIEGLKGKIIVALLACVASKAQVTEALATRPAGPSASSAAPAQWATFGKREPRPGLAKVGTPPAPGSLTYVGSSTNTASPQGRPGFSGLRRDGSAASSAGSATLPSTRRNFSSYFCKKVKGIPSECRDDVMSGLFVDSTDSFIGPFGLAEPGQVAAALAARACTKPGLGLISPDARAADTFFHLILGGVFEGKLQLIAPAGASRPPLQVHFHSNANQTSTDKEYLSVTLGNGATPDQIVESRYTVYTNAHAGWRYNLCSQAVAFLDERCPWGGDYDYEYKDFVVDTTGTQLGFNTYCRRRGDGVWVQLGTAILQRGAAQ